MLELFRAGGLLMWPLLLVSVISLAVMIERWLVFRSLQMPTFSKTAQSVLESFSKTPAFAQLAQKLSARNEDESVAEAQELINRLNDHLNILSVIVKLAPLLGLLGTVVGMIDTFSAVATASGGVQMAQLADGIWQALITTAAGLSIAIPTLFVLSFFDSYVNRFSEKLDRAIGIVLNDKE